MKNALTHAFLDHLILKPASRLPQRELPRPRVVQKKRQRLNRRPLSFSEGTSKGKYRELQDDVPSFSVIFGCSRLFFKALQKAFLGNIFFWVPKRKKVGIPYGFPQNKNRNPLRRPSKKKLKLTFFQGDLFTCQGLLLMLCKAFFIAIFVYVFL